MHNLRGASHTPHTPHTLHAPHSSAAEAPQWPPWLELRASVVFVHVALIASGPRSRMMGTSKQHLRVQLSGPGVLRGLAANALLIRFVADALQVARAQVQLVAGLTSPNKTVCLMGVEPGRVVWALGRQT